MIPRLPERDKERLWVLVRHIFEPAMSPDCFPTVPGQVGLYLRRRMASRIRRGPSSPLPPTARDPSTARARGPVPQAGCRQPMLGDLWCSRRRCAECRVLHERNRGPRLSHDPEARSTTLLVVLPVLPAPSRATTMISRRGRLRRASKRRLRAESRILTTAFIIRMKQVVAASVTGQWAVNMR